MQSDPSSRVVYPPLDVLKPVAPDVFVVDSGPLRAFGVPIPVRMTVIRLAGGMWLHSPTRHDAALRQDIEARGPIRWLVAPSVAHWLFVRGWQEQCRGAEVLAAPKLAERGPVARAGLAVDRTLSDAAPPDWAGEIDQIVVPGGHGFSEVVFFHRASRTLVLADLVQNFEADRLLAWQRHVVRLLGTMAPHGRAPAHLRWILGMRRAEAAAAVRRMLGWRPDRVILAHGRCLDTDAAARLEKAFAWLI